MIRAASPIAYRHLSGRRRFAALLWAGLTALLGGCLVSSPVAAPSPDAARHFADAFEMEGRLAASDGERAANGRIVWRHSPREDNWTVYSPLGQIVAQLNSGPAGATLSSADGKHLDAPDAQSMLPQLLGIAAPLESLPYWVQGIPPAGATASNPDSYGRPTRIRDSGWTIDYSAYPDTAADALPQRLEAYRGNARLRLIIDQWTILP